jgi:putative flippase GtrA
MLFALAGVAGLLVDAGIVVALRRTTSIDLVSAKLVGFAVAVTVTWLINRNLTYAGRKNTRLIREWTRYVAVNGVGGLINNVAYILAVFASNDIARHPEIGVAIGSLAGMVFNFASSRSYVFRHSAVNAKTVEEDFPL